MPGRCRATAPGWRPSRRCPPVPSPGCPSGPPPIDDSGPRSARTREQHRVNGPRAAARCGRMRTRPAIGAAAVRPSRAGAPDAGSTRTPRAAERDHSELPCGHRAAARSSAAAPPRVAAAVSSAVSGISCGTGASVSGWRVTCGLRCVTGALSRRSSPGRRGASGGGLRRLVCGPFRRPPAPRAPLGGWRGR